MWTLYNFESRRYLSRWAGSIRRGIRRGVVKYILYSLIVWIIVQRVMAMMRGNQPSRNNAAPSPPRSVVEPSPYDILGVSSTTPSAEIRVAYQNLVRQYHPDRVASMPEEFREVAERRTKEINAAYTQLKRSGRLADL
ncbi:MAG: J domain-containing protein [Clostridia bacterium]|nr:J domain-containing protein [Deltaproteobacteria bacterium]